MTGQKDQKNLHVNGIQNCSSVEAREPRQGVHEVLTKACHPEAKFHNQFMSVVTSPKGCPRWCIEGKGGQTPRSFFNTQGKRRSMTGVWTLRGPPRVFIPKTPGKKQKTRELMSREQIFACTLVAFFTTCQALGTLNVNFPKPPSHPPETHLFVE